MYKKFNMPNMLDLEACAVVLNYDFTREIEEKDIICADGGYNRAVKNGYKPMAVVGDLDSAKDIASDVEVIKFNKRKDKTDGELAVIYAINKGYRKISIYGASGGRMDHVMYNLRLVAIAQKMGVRCTIRGDGFDAFYANSIFNLKTQAGEVISIVPYSEKVHIMSTEGLEYEINDVEYDMFNTVCVSNVATGDNVVIKIAGGDALIFRIFRKEV